MIVNKIDKYNLLLGWSPKCACTSIKSAFVESIENIDYSTNFVHEQFYNSFPEVLSNDADSLAICFVRNPYERFLSAYFDRLKIYDISYRYLTLRNFLFMIRDLDLDKNNLHALNQSMFFNIDLIHHFLPQHREYDFEWDYVFNIDNIPGAFATLERKHSIKKLRVKYLNKSPIPRSGTGEFLGDVTYNHVHMTGLFNKNVDQWLDEYMKEELDKIYAKDFELLARSQ